MFSLRPAIVQDNESIQSVYCSIVGPTRGRERTWSRLIQKGYMVVAEVDAHVAGFGGIDPDAAEQLKWLYVLPEYQGFGIGSKILKKLEDIGWTHGLRAIRLHASPDAVEFYRRQGYRRIAAGDQVVHDHDGVEMIKDRG